VLHLLGYDIERTKMLPKWKKLRCKYLQIWV